jgi:hypothetical protein
MALKKQDAIVDEPNTNPKDAVEKFYGGLKNYKHKKPLEDLAVPGMIVKELLQHDNKDYTEFEEGRMLDPKCVHLKLSWINPPVVISCVCLWVEFY